MSDNTVLRTSQTMFEQLHSAVEGRRGTIKVARDVLMDLLLDHGNMAAKLEKLGVKVVDRESAPALSPRVRRRTR